MDLKKTFPLKIKPINKKLEKIATFFSLIVLLISLALIFYFIKSNYLQNISYSSMKELRNDIGEIGEYLFIFSIAMFVVRRILKYLQPSKLDSLSKVSFLKPLANKLKNLDLTYVKKSLQFIAVFLRQWHIPVSLLSFAIILFHGYTGFYYGIIKSSLSFKIGYYIGILDLIILFFVILSVRFKSKNLKKAHRILGILFIILMAVHISMI